MSILPRDMATVIENCNNYVSPELEKIKIKFRRAYANSLLFISSITFIKF